MNKSVVKVSRIPPDLRSGARNFWQREIRGPEFSKDAPDLSARLTGTLISPEDGPVKRFGLPPYPLPLPLIAFLATPTDIK
jgi:hypothetical protein